MISSVVCKCLLVNSFPILNRSNFHSFNFFPQISSTPSSILTVCFGLPGEPGHSQNLPGLPQSHAPPPASRATESAFLPITMEGQSKANSLFVTRTHCPLVTEGYLCCHRPSLLEHVLYKQVLVSVVP